MLAAPSLINSRHELLQRVVDARRRSDQVFDIVRPESLYERPIPERHRIVFYIGHLEAFDWNLLRERLIDRPAFHPEFDRLFAFGIDPLDGGLPNDQPSDWPNIKAVREYVRQVRHNVDSALTNTAFDDDGRYEFSPTLLLNVAIEHRLMHAETLAYMLHQLALEHKIRPTRIPHLVSPPVQPSMIHIPSGSVTLGLSRTDRNAFGWDNEFEAHTRDVSAFDIDKYKVTNGLYLEFVKAGGYDDRALWSEADWQWRTQQDISHPAFWNKKVDDQWRYRTMFEEIPLPLDWPVYVSHAEASAYARWAGKSLPTEAQWQRAAYGASQGSEHIRPSTGRESRQVGNSDFQLWDPTSVNAFPHAENAFGVAEMLGNGWEWTSTLFAPFVGFKAFSFYPGYSANFFDGQHYVMKGGSARTAACMIRPSFRNWFQPHYQYAYSAFRCVSN